jgi:hypothetical protein
MGAGSEILTQSKNYNLNLEVVEISIAVRYDISGTSSKNPVSHGFGVLGWLIRVISESRPLLFFEKNLYSMKKFMLNKSISKQ